jgi:hypothetical protein
MFAVTSVYVCNKYRDEIERKFVIYKTFDDAVKEVIQSAVNRCNEIFNYSCLPDLLIRRSEFEHLISVLKKEKISFRSNSLQEISSTKLDLKDKQIVFNLSDNVKLTDIDFDQNENLEDELLEKNRIHYFS